MIYLGMTIFSLSIVYILYLLIGIMVNGINNPGYFTTIAAVLLIGGIQLISIGVVVNTLDGFTMKLSNDLNILCKHQI